MGNEFQEIDKGKKVWAEFKDLCAGTAFPLMIMLVFSASIILFADAFSSEPAIGLASLIFGELLLAGAYVMFGRQNGAVAHKKLVVNSKKRELGSTDEKVYYKTGEFALWKGFVIPLMACVPFAVFQFVECVYHNIVTEFALKYAFGWAWYPFNLAGLSQWLNFIWIIPLVGIHAAAYFWGGVSERKKAENAAKMQAEKGKKRKK